MRQKKIEKEKESGIELEQQNLSEMTVTEFDQNSLQQVLSGEQHNLSRRKEKGVKKSGELEEEEENDDERG